ncbi:MAG: indole-3-glycerol phosphate synthase TrpC [Ruminococcaceae bacterium]|nr:indole-3-glycerol phosphate synthase TrpC [Oscillospiraceae bacterium]
MATILDELAMHAKMRVVEARNREPLSVVRERAEARPFPDFAFEKALSGPDLAFICEVKKASPSKGLIAPEFPYVQIAKDYEAAGADAISVLTEPKWFLGSKEYLNEIADAVSVPCLRKDFTVDEYMIWSARARGASAVLLICAILDDARLRAFRELADELGLSALVEAHEEREVERALKAGARVVGVNNRDLRDFTVDTGNSARLRSLIPGDVLYVSESGVKTAEDVAQLRAMGADAVLIGETLMRAADKTAKLAELRSRL